MVRRFISSGSTFEALAGYSRAVVDDDGWVHVSGTTGFDYTTMTIVDDVEGQTHRCFRTIDGVLREAGGSLADVVRARYLLVDAADFPKVAPIFAQYFGDARPAMTAEIVGLIDPRMKIEIEVTARLRGGSAR